MFGFAFLDQTEILLLTLSFTKWVVNQGILNYS